MANQETHNDRSDELEEVWSLFAEDCKEALQLVEETLLALESDPTNAGQVAKLFRAMHTFKGEARMMGLSVIELLAHHAEDLVALVRDEGVALSDAMIDLLLEVLDHSRLMLDHALAHRRDADADQVTELMGRLKAALVGHSEPALLPSKASGKASAPSPILGIAEEIGEEAVLAGEIIDPATDPEYVQIFLEMAEEELGRLRTALGALASGSRRKKSIQQIRSVADTLGHAAGRMGYERLVAMLDDLVATVEGSSGKARIVRLNELERALSEEMAAIQGQAVAQPPEPMESVQSLPGGETDKTPMPESDLLAIDEADNIENLYLTFNVQDEEYAVNVAYVTEIVGLQKISAVPDVPQFIKGVINLRGKVIPVMDMRLRFGLPWREYDDRTPIIVLELDGVPTGLVVDQVTDVISMLPGGIVPPPRWRGEDEQEGPTIKGLGKRDDCVSIFLDVPRLLFSDACLSQRRKPNGPIGGGSCSCS